MTTQISVETLSPIVYNQIPVITTELLAQLYGTEPVRIRQNHKRNAERFIEGKHYYEVVGDELKNLRVSLSYSQNPISPKTRTLILWTERGAARHAKMLETDQAWDVFEKLEDCYFSHKGNTEVAVNASVDILLAIRDGNVAFVRKFEPGTLITTDDAISLLKGDGWIVTRKEQLLERLMLL